MLCQKCKKYPATVSYVEISNGKKFEIHLCGDCYAELYGEVNSKTGNSLLAGLFEPRSRRVKSCPVCGTTSAEYEKTGLLGCTSCYDVFKEELMPYIRRIHGKVVHVGKGGGNNDEHGLHRILSDLQEKLEKALREKRFKEADALNLRIDEIKKRIAGGGKNG